MFTLLITLLSLALGLQNGPEGRKPCCSSSSSTSANCPPCEQQYVSLEDNAGAHPLYYGLPNSDFPTSQTFLVDSGPYGGVVFAWDCYCAGDKFQLFANGQDCGLNGKVGITDDQCIHYESNSRACVLNFFFSLSSCDLSQPNTLYNITVIQKTSPYGGGSGFITFFAADSSSNIPCLDDGLTCNFDPYERQYPCDFGN